MIVLLLVGATACGNVRGELSSAQCDPDDGVDDDGDHLFDCEDPDCWVYEFCASTHAASQSFGESANGETHDAGDDAQAPDAAASDAATPAPPLDASTTTHHSDGAATLPGTCSDAKPCPNGEICAEGACVQLPAGVPSYLVSIKSATLPDQAATATRTCFDNSLSDETCVGPGLLVCGNCRPDPFVIVTQNGEPMAVSPVQAETVVPTWPSFKLVITLHEGDELVFTVKDSDTGTVDDTIFFCEPDLSSLDVSSIVRCIPDPNESPTIAPPPGMDPWSVVATFERLPEQPL